MYKILGIDDKQYGPVNADVVRQWIADRRANSQTLVQAEGSAEWKPLSAYLEFAEALAAGPMRAQTAPPIPVTEARTSGLAIASLVLGLLGFCGITALLGVVLGVVAQIKINRSKGQLKGSGLAIAGICLSGFMLLFIPIMAGLMLPALVKAKGRAQTINCANHLKQLGLAVRMYANDNNDTFPPAANWCDAIQTHAASSKAFVCPSDTSGGRCSYAYNAKLGGKAQGGINPQTVLIFESGGGWNGSGGASLLSTHHERIYTVGLADGSVRELTASQLLRLRWDP